MEEDGRRNQEQDRIQKHPIKVEVAFQCFAVIAEGLQHISVRSGVMKDFYHNGWTIAQKNTG